METFFFLMQTASGIGGQFDTGGGFVGKMMNNWGKHSNLLSFLTHTTPSVPACPLPKASIQNVNPLSHPVGREEVEYFTMGDLWDQYSEWSVYGARVPVLLNDRESVVQFYVPYLSAIQIYTSKHLATSRTMLEESESESFSDDSESGNFSRSWDAMSDYSLLDQDGSCPTRRLIGQLYFQFIEYGSPYGRMPLVDKVNELALNYPGLTSLKSIEISPASWMCVAWYPIYHIPSTNVKDLSACFLTYHSISVSFHDNELPQEMVKDSYCISVERKSMKQKTQSNFVSLSPFGLSTYRMQGELWRNPETSDNEILSTLQNAAYSWLMQLGIKHHDFDFFATH